MRILLLISALFFGLCGCKQKEKKNLPAEGDWLGRLAVMDGETLPFNFSLNKTGDDYQMQVYNARETVRIDEIVLSGDSIIIKMPVFEGYIEGQFSENEITGNFIKESLDRIVPFQASHGKEPRFETSSVSNTNVSGVWETTFIEETGDSYPAKGIFTQNGNAVTGTFRTTTGDYRFLEGVVEGDSLKLSTFDGAHAFLFLAKVSDSILDGVFYSGNHSRETFAGKRNEVFELPDEESLTFLKDGFERLEFSFPDARGDTVSLPGPHFNDKVVVVQIMGTWCPNCLDETKFLAEYLAENDHPGLQVVALAFEYARTPEKAVEGIRRLQERIGVTYPILLAQYGTSSKLKANEKLPMLNHVLSYPTTIFIDKKGSVRKIHTGFNGPATGDKYEEFKREFINFVTALLRE